MTEIEAAVTVGLVALGTAIATGMSNWLAASIALVVPLAQTTTSLSAAALCKYHCSKISIWFNFLADCFL